MSDDTDAVATMRRDLAEAEAERDAAQADLRERVLRAGGYAIQLAQAEAHIKALQIKLDALAPHGSCGCSYDTPGQVCQHHSPQLAAALARAEKAEAELSGFHSAMRQQVTFISKIEAYLIHLAYSGEIDPETENAIPWGEVARRHEARATTAEAEVARLAGLLAEAVETLERIRDLTPYAANTVSADGHHAATKAIAATTLDAILTRLKEPTDAE